MAAVVARPSRPDALAAGLMGLVVLRDFGWAAFEPAARGMASKGLGGLLVLVLLAVVWRMAGRLGMPLGWLAWPVGYGAWSALQTVLCSASWLVDPWTVPEGQGICASRTDLDLGALALLVASVWAVRASPVRVDTTKPE